MKYLRKFNEDVDPWNNITSMYDVGQLLELLIFKYGRIFTESIREFDEDEGDYNPDDIYDTIRFELEEHNLYDDFITNYEKYGIEKDENDPFHWRYRQKEMDKFKSKFLDGLNEASAYDADPKIRKWRNDIVKKLVYYYKKFDSDSLTKKIEEYMYEYDDVLIYYEEHQVIDDVVINMLIDNILESWDAVKDDFIELYYDVYQTLKNRGEDLTDHLKEIFSDYSDDSSLKVTIHRSASEGNDKYVINISGDDMLFSKISFNEIINRVKDIGLTKFKYSGDDDSISFSFWKKISDNYDNVNIED